jgi:hypothetical protein
MIPIKGPGHARVLPGTNAKHGYEQRDLFQPVANFFHFRVPYCRRQKLVKNLENKKFGSLWRLFFIRVGKARYFRSYSP